MLNVLRSIYHSFPVQLFLLHFKKYQILLVIWYMLFSIINGGLLKNYGAEALFFTPEYNDKVNVWSIVLLGIAWGMFIMTWQITTFIMHTKRFEFLASVKHPFLKYCINNSILPLSFLIFYFVRLFQYVSSQELKVAISIYAEIAGILLGITIIIFLGFGYFWGTAKAIHRRYKRIEPGSDTTSQQQTKVWNNRYGLDVEYLIDEKFKFTNIASLNKLTEIESNHLFQKHQLSAVFAIILGFVLLATIGVFLDYWVFELPAAACIILLFSITIGVLGAFTYFLKNWSLPFAILFLVFLNYMVEYDFLDPRNQAYGLDYTHKENGPVYSKATIATLCTPQKIEHDKQNMLQILDNWKARQQTAKPVMIFINTSGGGLRSAAFSMNSLQKLDSITGGKLMRQTFLISGASGGMIAASYYRELYRNRQNEKDNVYGDEYQKNITTDILNSVFSSLVTRDILNSKQSFKVGKHTYSKDRGYAFEQKLISNTGGLLSASFEDVKEDEYRARVPLIMYNAIINSDGRKFVMSSQPVAFMMKPAAATYDEAAQADAVDLAAFFKNENPQDMRLVTAIRMNASFPYILPNVWLPSKPVIDVMDAGLRDNFGQETTLRFIDHFSDWIAANTGGVLIIQLRDGQTDNWQQPVITKTVSDMLITPGTMVQQNWHKIQQNFMSDQYYYFKSNSPFKMYRAEIKYIASNEKKSAAMSLHITASEKKDVIGSFYRPVNQAAIDSVKAMLSSNRLQ